MKESKEWKKKCKSLQKDKALLLHKNKTQAKEYKEVNKYNAELAKVAGEAENKLK